MTAEHPQGDEPLIPLPALSLPALRQAVATVAPSRARSSTGKGSLSRSAPSGWSRRTAGLRFARAGAGR